ncbi:unnamed protein product [Penicillium glandicola]
MAEWAALTAVSEGLGAAFTAYGKYQELFGPALQTIDWNEYIRASERRIISAIKEVEFKTYTRRLASLSEWWTGTCVDFLRNYPISPGNIQAFNAKIGIGRLRENILSLNEILKYFGSDEAPGDYGTYGALVTAYSLNYIFLTVAETYFVAANGKKSGGKEIRAAAEAGVRDTSFWMPKYVRERATHMTVEIEQKYSGGGGPLGRAGQKRTTGWYIVHDTANDPVVGTFEGQRFYRQFPKKDEMVSGRFYSSKLVTTWIKDVWKNWNQLRVKAIDAETS